MTVDAIKQAIQVLDAQEQRQLAEWLEEEFLSLNGPEQIHAKIGIGLAQLDRGEGVSGEVSRARLQERKAVWLKQPLRS